MEYFFCRIKLHHSRKYTLFLLLISGCVFSLFSCETTKNYNYFQEFQKDTSVNTFVASNMELKIRKNDLVTIQINSMNKDDDAIYNLSGGGSSGSSSSGSSSSSGISSASSGSAGSPYLVDNEGNIQLHKIGIIHVEGFTLEALRDSIQKALQPYLLDPIVTTSFAGQMITVLGQVGRPGQINLSLTPPMDITDAIALSGDVNAQLSDPSNILIIRQTDTGRVFKHIDMTKKNIFDSTWYYLKPNDIVYVPADNSRINEPIKQQNRAVVVQTVSLITSAISLTFLVIKLL